MCPSVLEDSDLSEAPHATPRDIVKQSFREQLVEDEGLPTHRGWGPLHWELAWQVILESPSNL